MAVSNIKAVFPFPIEKVWETVTSLEHCTWRSDLSKVEAVQDGRFIEYTKKGYATAFTVTVWEPCKRWEFDMENDNIQGHWTGVFLQVDGQTEIEFTEEVFAKKKIIKPFLKMYLKKQQRRYVSDLRKALLQG